MLLSISYGSISPKPDGGLYTFSLSYNCVFPCPVFILDLFGTKMKPNQFSVDINPYLRNPKPSTTMSLQSVYPLVYVAIIWQVLC